jgi:hypothetical protein
MRHAEGHRPGYVPVAPSQPAIEQPGELHLHLHGRDR